MDADPLNPPADLPPAPHPVWARWLWLVGGWVALGLGTVGVFLPVIPTTPFVLVAAWCFSKGSHRMHRWLLEHRWFGSTVRSWEAHGVIPLRAKLLSTGIMIPLVGYMVLFSDAPTWAVLMAVPLVLVGVGFIWSKPSRPDVQGGDPVEHASGDLQPPDSARGEPAAGGRGTFVDL